MGRAWSVRTFPTHAAITELQANLARAGVDFFRTENLCTFDGEVGYALGQGQ